MSGSVLLKIANVEHEEKLRRAQAERLALAAQRSSDRPSLWKSLWLLLASR